MIVGLTGGIGSGKSTAAAFFAELNIPVIKADKIIRTLTAPHTPAYQAIRHKFGNEVLHNSGELNRAKLRQIIFTDSAAKDWLENLLHPKLYQIIASQIEQIKSPYCILEIPLLIEKKPPINIDRILVIDCPLDQQIQRTTTRDNIAVEDIQKIINSQLDRQTRLAKCHDVIVNDGSLENLKQKIIKLHHQYLGHSNK